MKAFATSLFLMSTLALAADPFQSQDYLSIKALDTAVQNLSTIDQRCAEASDCVPVALGNKACGGPRAYTFTSKENLNYKEILMLASSLKEKEKKFNINYGIISTCEYILAPELTCHDKKCSIVSQ